jgi:hypothetical protein
MNRITRVAFITSFYTLIGHSNHLAANGANPVRQQNGKPGFRMLDLPV